MADSARTALSHMDDQEVDQIEAYHPEWDPLDGKHVPWSPAFKFQCEALIRTVSDVCLKIKKKLESWNSE